MNEHHICLQPLSGRLLGIFPVNKYTSTAFQNRDSIQLWFCSMIYDQFFVGRLDNFYSLSYCKHYCGKKACSWIVCTVSFIYSSRFLELELLVHTFKVFWSTMLNRQFAFPAAAHFHLYSSTLSIIISQLFFPILWVNLVSCCLIYSSYMNN